MSWEEKCIPALLDQEVFLSPQHFSRFETIFAFLRHQQFFNKGLCKYAVLASWDQAHFNYFDSAVHEMAENKEITCDTLIKSARKYTDDPDQNRGQIVKLAIEFLEHPDSTPSETLILKLSKAWIPIVDSAISASLALDNL
ncbi:MAG: hypothetical protein EOM18_08140 [Clostridia bacterium]|nr:hypothetical protein [Clostridia bacterium]